MPDRFNSNPHAANPAHYRPFGQDTPSPATMALLQALVGPGITGNEPVGHEDQFGFGPPSLGTLAETSTTSGFGGRPPLTPSDLMQSIGMSNDSDIQLRSEQRMDPTIKGMNYDSNNRFMERNGQKGFDIPNVPMSVLEGLKRAR